jgi:hypothetical protein
MTTTNTTTDVPFTVIDDGSPTEVVACLDGTTVRLSAAALRTALGVELKPEGLCKGPACYPVGRPERVTDANGIDLAACADILGRPLAVDLEARAAYVGVSAVDRGARLASLEAPDFQLPDLDGRLHSLSDYRGKKVLLIAHSSW